MKKNKSMVVWYGIIVVAYVLTSMLVPVNQQTLKQYRLNNLHYHLLLLAIIVPLLAIWLAAFYGYRWLKDYTETLNDTPDSKPFTMMSRGFGWFAWGLPITGLISTIMGGISANGPSFHGPATIINNYATLLVAFVAFRYISKGAQKLSRRTGRSISAKEGRVFMVIFIALAVTYCYLIFTNFEKHRLAHHNVYYLPSWLVMLTIVAPYLYAWFLGLWSALEIGHYENSVAGIIYKRALHYLAIGLGVVILSSISIQYVTSISAILSNRGLNVVLTIIYALLAIYGVGFVFVATGAQKLKRIEEA